MKPRAGIIIEDMTELEEIENLLTRLKAVKQSIKKRDRLFDKATEWRVRSPRQVQKIDNEFNWEAMRLDQFRTEFARAFRGSTVDVSPKKKEYNPSGFRKYKG